MRVQMTVAVTGTRDGRDWPGKGEAVHLPDAEARDLIAAGLAVEVATAPQAEKAANPKPRTARAPKAETR